jgi:hypothetical protein
MRANELGLHSLNGRIAVHIKRQSIRPSRRNAAGSIVAVLGGSEEDGSWKPFEYELIPLTRRNIALYNGITAGHCQRFLFSSTRDFCWLDKEGKVRYDFDPLAKPLNHQE